MLLHSATLRGKVALTTDRCIQLAGIKPVEGRGKDWWYQENVWW